MATQGANVAEVSDSRRDWNTTLAKTIAQFIADCCTSCAIADS